MLDFTLYSQTVVFFPPPSAALYSRKKKQPNKQIKNMKQNKTNSNQMWMKLQFDHTESECLKEQFVGKKRRRKWFDV